MTMMSQLSQLDFEGMKTLLIAVGVITFLIPLLAAIWKEVGSRRARRLNRARSIPCRPLSPDGNGYGQQPSRIWSTPTPKAGSSSPSDSTRWERRDAEIGQTPEDQAIGSLLRLDDSLPPIPQKPPAQRHHRFP